MPTFIGKPVTVAEDKQLQVGDTLRDFNLTATDLTKKSLSEFDGKKKVISIVPSIDTGICSTQTRTFNKELSELDDTVVITISVDLPFAQARWCGAEGLENAIMLSDYYDNSFGKDYGVLIEEWHLLARAVLVADADNKITYVEYLDNINTDPMSEKERPQLIIDYEANTDKLVRLGDVVDQFKGKAVPAKAEPGEFAVINLSDMTPNGIAYDDLKTFSEERRKLLRFLLEDGDVLIASKGTVHKVAVFEDQGKREVVASSNITVLRPKEKLRGFYIKFFLETDIGRAYLDYADKGKAVLNLSTADLLDIKIPEIPIVKQDYQIAAYLRGRADFHRKMVRAKQEWENIQHNVTEALFGN